MCKFRIDQKVRVVAANADTQYIVVEITDKTVKFPSLYTIVSEDKKTTVKFVRENQIETI